MPKGAGLTISLLNVDKLAAHRKETVYDRKKKKKKGEIEAQEAMRKSKDEDKRQGQRR